MFVTVKFGADHQILLNSNCKVVNLIESLKEQCKCGSDVTIDLLDELGNLVNLSDLEGSQEIATNYLRERQCYVLVKVIRDGSDPAQYESLLENLWKRYPELAERLQKLSNPHLKDKWRNSNHKKVRPTKEATFTSPSKSRMPPQQKSRLS
uniref:Chromosome 22 open reading frame 15 n=1 Tax=Leptobrachium leishanense TaxID=445787 RepID=A0A8C5PIS3_9ANUR